MSLWTHIPWVGNPQQSIRQIVSNTWSDRDQVVDSDVNLFCWKRPVDPVIHELITEMIDQNPSPISHKVCKNLLFHQIEEISVIWKDHFCSDSSPFWEDVLKLVHDFLSFSFNQKGTLHLKVVSNDACAKFHTDGYDLRLFTTYYGQGTEWLPEQATRRSALGTTNEHIVKDPSQIRRMEPFEVGILKGEVSGRASDPKGIVHRSPEISRLNEKRLILRIDI